MVIAILLILLVVGVAVVGALYSSFLAFYTTFGDTVEYNKAYYAATSALERAELVLRYRAPGYEWSWGWISETNQDGSPSDVRPNDFSFFSDKDIVNGMVRDIRSRTTQIPRPGEGNIEWMLATGDDALNYNMLDYVNAENFVFNLDSGKGKPYTGLGDEDWDNSKVRWFTGMLRLPPLLTTGSQYGGFEFGKLDDDSSPLNSQLGNDAIVDWGFRGKVLILNTDSTRRSDPFQILPTTDVSRAGTPTVNDGDSLLRESVINDRTFEPLKLQQQPLQWWNDRSPLWKFNDPHYDVESPIKELTVLSASEQELKGKRFSDLLALTNVTNLIFRIAVLNLLSSKSKHIYPYLEYQFSFYDEYKNPADISDRFYTITARGKFGNYEVKLLVKKPTIKESILGNFTVLF